MKSLFTSPLLLLSASTIHADYSDCYNDLPIGIKKVETFSVPSLTVDLSDFGAVGDGVTLSTEAFTRAIDHLSARGGGRLNVPRGLWLTGPFELRSNIELHLERNA